MSATFTKVLLSASTNGTNILVTGSLTSSLTTIHTTIPFTSSIDSTDEIYLYGCNNTTSSTNLTLYWGNTGSADTTTFTLYPQTGRILIADGKLLMGGLSISASSNIANVNIDGFVNRISNQDIDPLVAAWAQRVVLNGGLFPSQNTQQALSAFVIGLEQAGLLAKMLTVNCFVPDSLSASITPLLRDGNDPWTNHNYTGSDITINGLTGDASSRYLDTGFIPSAMFNTQTNAGFSQYITQFNTVGKSDFGAISGTDFVFSWNFTTNTSSNAIGAGANAITAPIRGNGFYTENRVSSTDHRIYYANSTQSIVQLGTTDSTAFNGTLPAVSCFLAAFSNSGNPSNYSNNRYSFAAVHYGLTINESGTLFNLVQIMRRNLGGGYV